MTRFTKRCLTKFASILTLGVALLGPTAPSVLAETIAFDQASIAARDRMGPKFHAVIMFNPEAEWAAVRRHGRCAG